MKRDFYVVVEKDEDGFFVGEVPQLRNFPGRSFWLFCDALKRETGLNGLLRRPEGESQ